jgi:hypothetical protein
MTRITSILLAAFLVGSIGGCKGSVPAIDRHVDTLCTGIEQVNETSSGKDEASGMSEATGTKYVTYVNGEAISAKHVTYVESVGKFDKGPPGPVDVAFYGHAAVFDLERGHPCFQNWLRILEKSEAAHSAIVFTHTTIGMYIRSVETGEKITGIVEELVHGIHNSVGFTMRNYMDIFLIPDNHPQLLEWLVLVQKSKNGKMKIVFAYDAYHRRVTSLALAEH